MTNCTEQGFAVHRTLLRVAGAKYAVRCSPGT